jgi:hypothetical protein
MGFETNEGISYLLALKRSRSVMTGSGAAAAQAPSTGADKRRSPRYKCEGKAEIRKEGIDVRTWATFTDVSLHGCYLECPSTYAVGTKLGLKLDANGVHVESRGEVRVNYPALGMGVAFVDMSEDNRARLKQMLATLVHPMAIMGPGIMGPGVASSLPEANPLCSVPSITNPQAAVQALMQHFEKRQMLMRDDFLRILNKSQTNGSERPR